jgi:predicted transcriptional regulator
MNGEMTEVFQIGSAFPAIAGSSICLQEDQKIRSLEMNVVKKKIIDYLNLHGSARISILAEELEIPPRMIAQAIKLLEEDALIKDTD